MLRHTYECIVLLRFSTLSTRLIQLNLLSPHMFSTKYAKHELKSRLVVIFCLSFVNSFGVNSVELHNSHENELFYLDRVQWFLLYRSVLYKMENLADHQFCQHISSETVNPFTVVSFYFIEIINNENWSEPLLAIHPYRNWIVKKNTFLFRLSIFLVSERCQEQNR